MVLAKLITSVIFASGAFAKDGRVCRALPDTPEWPDAKKWEALNATVNGGLISTVPLAAVCHLTFNNQSTYNKAECDRITAGWASEKVHLDHPTSIFWNFWTNSTCLPTTDPKQPCTLGTYPNYVIDATTVEHVQAGVNFARENNIRLVIRNTGHDFLGKSTGAASLSIWMHNFNDISYDEATGIATIGAGWKLTDLYAYFAKKGRTLVAGECPNVGFVGGFIQGGGHGPLTAKYGMAADYALSFKLVTAEGQYITADATQNTDLFWALRGGAGSTWGVVTSVTVQTVPDLPVPALSLIFNEPDTDKFWKGFYTFHEDAVSYMENEMFLFYIMNQGVFVGGPILAPGKTLAQLQALVAPLLARLDKLGVHYVSQFSDYPTFLDMYKGQFTYLDIAGTSMITGSRIMSKESVATNLTKILDTYKSGAEAGLSLVGYMLRSGGPGGEITNNAVNPAWRNAVLVPLYNGNLVGTEVEAQRNAMIDLVNGQTAKLAEFTPGGGSYLNEANPFDPNWKSNFWGLKTYDKLLEIKKKWDPKGVFYAKSAVGSDLWEDVRGQLCQVQ